MSIVLYSANDSRPIACSMEGGTRMDTIVPLLIQDTFFLLVILLARALLIGRVQYRHIMLLWHATLIRLLLPFPLTPPIDLVFFHDNLGTFVPLETPAHFLAQSGSSWLATSAGHVVLGIWATGALLALTVHLANYCRWARAHSGIGPVDDCEIRSCVQEFESKRKRFHRAQAEVFLGLLSNKKSPYRQTGQPPVKLQPSSTHAALLWDDNLESPVTRGCIFPVILLPISTAGLDICQKRHIVEHELTHVHRQDCLLKLLLAFVCCLFWFNPLIWIMRMLVNQDIELACDEAVAWYLTPSRKRSYANLLLQFASTSGNTNHIDAAAFSSNAASLLSARIQALRKTSQLIDLFSLAKCLTAIPLALVLSTTGIASCNNPWNICTSSGSIILPEAWRGKVAVCALRTESGSSLTEIYPLGQDTYPLVAFGEANGHLEDKEGCATLVAITSDNEHVSALWSFDYSDSVSELPKWDNSIPLVNAWQLSTGGNPDMDSLEFLQQEVVPTFRAA